MRLWKSGFIAAACLWLTACAHVAPVPRSTAAAAPMTVMVSLDAFRPDYLDRGVTPNLNAIAAEGVRVTSVKPSFPSLTFPNHYTLVTGLIPDHHGIVANIMDDPVLGHFDKPSDDRRWFDAGLPLWVSAEQAGIRSGVVFWPGSIADVRGVRPTYWLSFSKTSADERVDKALSWLDGPADKRPRFLAIYLDEVDVAGHAVGPVDPRINTAVATVDTAIGRLVAGLKARGLWDRTNLVVVSDHGMASIDKSKIDYAEKIVDPAIARAINPSPFTEFRPTPGREAEAEAALLAPHANFQCWKKEDFPARYHYGSNPRVAPYLCLSNPHSEIRKAGQLVGGGDHGFDPADPDMQAFMVARGPAFRAHLVLPPIDNTDVYPLMAELLGVRPGPNDGDPAHLAGALK